MALYFITGIAGSGKSTICKELKSKGYTAYDTDDDGLSKWQDIATGYIHPKSSVKPEQRTEDFLKSHQWNIPKSDWDKLTKEAKDKPVFLCGVADNASKHMNLIKQVFALSIDENTLRHRITTRTNNDWGKQQHELESTLRQQSYINKFYERKGFIIIDATKPAKELVNEILSQVQL